jgi:hypothetical protein
MTAVVIILDLIGQKSVLLMHWFSTFLSSRHTNFFKKFGGTSKCNNIFKIFKNCFPACYFSYINIWWKHICKINRQDTNLSVAAYRLRTTVIMCLRSFIIDNQMFTNDVFVQQTLLQKINHCHKIPFISRKQNTL